MLIRSTNLIDEHVIAGPDIYPQKQLPTKKKPSVSPPTDDITGLLDFFNKETNTTHQKNSGIAL